MNTRYTFRRSRWPAGSRLLEVDRWLLEVGCGMSTAGSRLLPDGKRLSSARSSCFKYCFSHSYDYISGPPATDRSEDHTPWKASGAGVAAQRTHSLSSMTPCKINSLATAVSPLLWLSLAGVPESSSLAVPQQADLMGPRKAQRGKSLLVTAAPSKELLAESNLCERLWNDPLKTTFKTTREIIKCKHLKSKAYGDQD